MSNIGNYLTSKMFIDTLIIIAVLVAVLIFIKQYLIKKVAYHSRKEHKNTIDGLLFNLLQYVVIIIAIFALLSVNGINITGMLASLGIVATIVGLSLQDTFKDLFAGLNIYSNNYYKVGDYVKYNGEVCIVKFFNARVTKFSSIITGSTYTVSNSCINQIEKIKFDTSISFVFDYDVDAKIVDKALEVVRKKVDDLPETKYAKYFGIVSLNSSGVTYLIKFGANPDQQMGVQKKASEWAYYEFKAAGIAPIFFNDRDIVISDKEKFYKKTNKKVSKSGK